MASGYSHAVSGRLAAPEKKESERDVRLHTTGWNMRPTAGYLIGCKGPDCCVGVRLPSQLKKKKKKIK